MKEIQKNINAKEIFKSKDFKLYLSEKKIQKLNLKHISNFVFDKKTYKPKNKEELKKLILNKNINLADILTDEIKDMSWLFHNVDRDFSGISTWNVSKVEDMNSMFSNCYSFNENLCSWNVSKVKSMAFMFKDCKNFNQNISSWQTQNLENTAWMFHNCFSFNQNLSSWNVGKVKDMNSMFYNCFSFNQNLSSWQVDEVKDFSWMFKNCFAFSQDICSWNIIKSDNIEDIFKNCKKLNKDFVYKFLFNINERTKKLLQKDKNNNFQAKSQKEVDFLLKIGVKLEQIDQSNLASFQFNFKTYETDEFKISELNFGKKLIIAQIKPQKDAVIEPQIINDMKLLKN